MKNKQFFIVIFELFYFFLFSCNTKSKRLDSQNGQNLKTSANIICEIPIDKKGRYSIDYREDKIIASLLNLDSLEIGYDSLQIRIWFDYSLAIKKHLVVIKNNLSKWSSELYTYTYNSKGKSVEIKKTEPLTQVTDLQRLKEQLFALQIMNLPNAETIPDLEGGLDGTTYNIEIATKKSYRYYSYWSPETTQNEHWQSNNMVKIIELLEHEFNFKRSQD
jgi:hypothetical protein